MDMVGGWWLTYPSEQYESIGMMTLPIYGKMKNMFQTTNQFPCGPIILPLPSGKQLHITMAEITIFFMRKLTNFQLGHFP